MKTKMLCLLFFVGSYGFSQSVNDYVAVIIPLRYDFQKVNNQYKLQTMTKVDLEKAGFKAFYSNEVIPVEYKNRCSFLYVDVKDDDGFLTSNLYVFLKDCYGSVVVKSDLGKSREKEFQPAYIEALNNAFKSIYDLKYEYNGNVNFAPKAALAPLSEAAVAVVSVSLVKNDSAEIIVESESDSADLLNAQPTAYGYQLVDAELNVIMKLYNTSSSISFMAKKGAIQGVLVSKEKQWYFEYYENDQLISEKMEVKF